MRAPPGESLALHLERHPGVLLDVQYAYIVQESAILVLPTQNDDLPQVGIVLHCMLLASLYQLIGK
jgi:hypothetical protein